MIRLYIDQAFQEGKELLIPKDEVHYLKNVRRERGEVEVFNRQGQVARGKIEGDRFIVDQILDSIEFPIWPVRLAVALPDYSVWKDIVSQTSEIGVDELIFFPARRSQAALKRREQIKKLDRTAIESARQCGRSRPIRISWMSWEEVINQTQEDLRLFLDEKPSPLPPEPELPVASAFLMIGCEGGWSEEERQSLLSRKFQPIHFRTPIMRVVTACSVAAFYAVQKLDRGDVPS